MSTENSLVQSWQSVFEKMPLIAILRGIEPGECMEIAAGIFDAGFEILEIPLNSPQPYESISRLTRAFPEKLIGAGTVTTLDAVASCKTCNCKLVVTPNFNPKIAEAVKSDDMIFCPGVTTPSEAFMALNSGANALKLFPAEMISPKVVKAMRAVLPADTTLIPVGGIGPENMQDYLEAGANGFGIGSALYKPGKPLLEVRRSAEKFVLSLEKSRGREV